MTARGEDPPAGREQRQAIARLARAVDHFRLQAVAREEDLAAARASAEAMAGEVEGLRRELASRDAELEEARRRREALEFELGRLHRELDALDGALEVRQRHLEALWRERIGDACGDLEEALAALIGKLAADGTVEWEEASGHGAAAG